MNATTEGSGTPSPNGATGTARMPPRAEMLRAFMSRDGDWDGLFVAGVSTTGIYCIASCPARKPRPAHVRFFAAPQSAEAAGFRPCRRCDPGVVPGSAPAWIRPLLDAVDGDPTSRWTDRRLASLGLSPVRVRRWFKSRYGMTFHRYSRDRRLAAAKERTDRGTAVSASAFAVGWESLSAFNEAFRQTFGAAPTGAGARTTIYTAPIATPLGPMVAAASGEGLHLLEFHDRVRLETQITRVRRGLDAAFVPGRSPMLERLEVELGEYFAGVRSRFTVPVLPVGSAFQREVWTALSSIAPGTTVSYSELASIIGRPGAARAVGQANADNAVAILIPCHRVVASDGALTGYGAGIWRKRRLLELEAGAHPQR